MPRSLAIARVFALGIPVVDQDGCSSAASGRKSATERRVTPWGVSLLIGLGLTLTSCGGSAPSPDEPGVGGGPTRRDVTIVHEPCAIDGPGASRKDANGDGKPDVIAVREGGNLTCQWLDLNFDQVGDVWVYFSTDGNVRRRETDFDRDGRVDEITTLSGGKIVSRERATTLAGRLDTWQYFENGAVHHAERDANGDGVIDQWWEYKTAGKPDCALVHSDTDGDGRPDPGATVDVCGSEVAASKSELDGETQDEPPAGDELITETTNEVTEAEPTAPPESSAKPPGNTPVQPPAEEDEP